MNKNKVIGILLAIVVLIAACLGGVALNMQVTEDTICIQDGWTCLDRYDAMIYSGDGWAVCPFWGNCRRY